MSEAPERIWACVTIERKLGITTVSWNAKFPVDGWQEYVRADRIEALEAERDALREALRKAEAALADIAEGEPDPDDLAEKIWCKGRAAAALTEARTALNRENDT